MTSLVSLVDNPNHDNPYHDIPYNHDVSYGGGITHDSLLANFLHQS